MDKHEETLMTKEETAAVEESKLPNHTEKIKSQVLAKIGKPPRLERIEVCRHHKGKYRVNIWQEYQADKSIAITPGSRIGPSYYLTVSDTGEIIHSDPPMTKMFLYY